MEIKFTIPLVPRTKKNSQRIVSIKRKGKYVPIPLPSEKFEEYQNDCGLFIKGKHLKIDTPCEIIYHFFMPTLRPCDLTNLEEAIDDILVHYGVIKDDNYKILYSHDGSRVHYDKLNPRTEITIKFEEE